VQSCVSWRVRRHRVDVVGSMSSAVPPSRRSVPHHTPRRQTGRVKRIWSVRPSVCLSVPCSPAGQRDPLWPERARGRKTYVVSTSTTERDTEPWLITTSVFFGNEKVSKRMPNSNVETACFNLTRTPPVEAALIHVTTPSQPAVCSVNTRTCTAQPLMLAS